MRGVLIGLVVLPAVAAADPAVSVKGHVAVKLRAVQAALDAAVPATIDELGAWTVSGSVGYRFGVWRDPIAVSTTSSAIVASTHVAYGLAGCVAAFGGCHEVASCGLDAPHATVDVQLSASGKWQPDWSLAPSVSVRTTQGTACKLTRLSIDASAIALAALNPALQAAMALFGRSVDVRAYADDLWAKVPATQLGPELWLAWDVAHVVVGPLQFASDAIGSDVELDVVPRLVEGPRAPANGPLPATLETTSAPASKTLALEVVAPWPDLEAMFAAVVGTVNVGGTDIRLVHVRGDDTGVTVELEGSAARVTAQLVYDEAADDLHAQNLRVGTGQTFVEKAIASALEPALHVQLRPLVARHLHAIDQALTDAHVAHPNLTANVEQHVSLTSAGARVQIVVPGALAVTPKQP